MGEPAPGRTVALARPWTRRSLFALALLPLGMRRAGAQPATPMLLVVSRKRLLNETDPARALQKAEAEMTATLQGRIDVVKSQLTAEEQELTKLRQTMDRKLFDARVAVFDTRVRSERRKTQKLAAALQKVFRDARLTLLDSLGQVLEAERVARGATVILNADQVLVADPAADVTDAVIARVNATVPTPAIPDLETLDAGPDTEPGFGTQPEPPPEPAPEPVQQ